MLWIKLPFILPSWLKKLGKSTNVKSIDSSRIGSVQPMIINCKKFFTTKLTEKQ